MSEVFLEIWTDGACKCNPGPGGWGVLMRYGEHKKELFGGDLETTNNKMELTAVIEAFRAVKRPCKLRLHLDSSYVKNGITQWIHTWKRKGWRTTQGPVKNVELWQELDRLVSNYPETIDWQWVKGHAGNPGNERADQLANMGVDKVLREAKKGS